MKYCRYVMKYYCTYVSSLYETYICTYVFSYIFECRYGDGLLARPSYQLEPQVLLCSCWAPSPRGATFSSTRRGDLYTPRLVWPVCNEILLFITFVFAGIPLRNIRVYANIHIFCVGFYPDAGTRPSSSSFRSDNETFTLDDFDSLTPEEPAAQGDPDILGYSQLGGAPLGISQQQTPQLILRPERQVRSPDRHTYSLGHVHAQ